MSQFVALFDRIVREEEGQDLVEYALLVAGIAVVVYLAVYAFGGELNTFWGGLGAKIFSGT